ncbi:hypothetical protein [Hamadaea tsunoensis]|uniref:hypothetical protein n=1 Tax=Hamadaea tsunoensis TaxID=53368 RepID=UPI0003F94DF4|nr:hypothetical protein [Hamadaea tsunoensis]
MHRYAKVVLAAAVAGLTVLAGTPAHASGGSVNAVDVLTVNALAGPNVAVNDVLQASLKAGTKVTFMSTPGGTTGVTCTVSTFSAKVLTNPGAGGTATESLTVQTFSTCTANVPGVTCVSSVTVDNLPYGATVNGTTKAVTITGTTAKPIQTTVKLCTLLGTITCVYQADLNTVTGTASNTDNSITFTNQKFNKTMGPSTCFPNGYFSAVYAPVLDTTQANGKVFTQ